MNILFVYPNLDCQIGFPFDADRVQRDPRTAKPDLVGFSVLTNQFATALRVARATREVTNAPLVWGGIHPTMAPREVLESGLADYVCVGEGEFALLDLVDRLQQRGSVTDIPNIWAKRNGHTVQNPVRPFADLTRLPRKDYETFDFQQMIDAKDGWATSPSFPTRHAMVFCSSSSPTCTRKEATTRRRICPNATRCYRMAAR